MKKLFTTIVSFAVFFGFGVYSAEASDTSTPTLYGTSPIANIDLDAWHEELKKAIKTRQKLYWNSKKPKRKNARNSYQSFVEKVKTKGFSMTSTELSRTGDLQTIPDYKYRREYSQPNGFLPNSRQVFKRRAIDYFVEGGDATPEEILSNLAKEERKKKASTLLSESMARKNVADIRREILDSVRYRGASEKVKTGEQKDLIRPTSGAQWNFIHPYMPKDY